MQPSPFRRLFRSRSPKKRPAPSSTSSSPTSVHHMPVHHTPPIAEPSAHPLFHQEALPPDPAAALTSQYHRYLARISTRAQQLPRPLLHSQRSVSPPPDPLASPPPSPDAHPHAFSRLHRRAMRDITLPVHPPPASSNPAADYHMDTDPENTPPAPALPPMYVGVDPRLHFSGFVKAGNGASGTVFFANRVPAPHLPVALKRVSPSTKAKSKALENEIRTMHVLRHPNIVQCHEAYSYDGSVWIVMEAMDVGCLTHVLDFLRAKAYLLSEDHIAYILRETLLGLWTMHSHSRMHRDIKSDNILVSSDGEIKLADFEYTAVLTEDTPKRNTVVGTAWWMAPETVRNSYYDYGADVWSIGILSVECAEWVPPLFGMESNKAMEVIRSGATIQGFKRPDMWSVEFADFVRGCLTRDRALRYTVPDLLRHPFLDKACTKTQIANVFRAVRGMNPIESNE